VDVISFHNTSHLLREGADNFVSGFFIPGLTPVDGTRVRGYMYSVCEDKYYGFLTCPIGLKMGDYLSNIFVHGLEVEGGRLTNSEFGRLKGPATVMEFDLVRDEKGTKATKAIVLKPAPKAAVVPAVALPEPSAQEATVELTVLGYDI